MITAVACLVALVLWALAMLIALAFMAVAGKQSRINRQHGLEK